MSLKERLFERYIRKHPQKQSGFPNWEKVRNICILAEAATDDQEALALADCSGQLENTGKTVQLVTYADSPERVGQGLVFCRKDFSLFGRPHKDVTDQLAEPTDLLIDLTKRPLLPMRYLAFCTNAKFKAGRKLSEKDEDGIHNMLIQTDNTDTEFVFRQIIHYIETIRSND